MQRFEKIKAFWNTFEGKVIIALVIISLGCAYGIYEGNKTAQDAQELGEQNQVLAHSNKKLILKHKELAHKFTDQSCRSDEQDNKDEVDQLKQTYDFLEQAKPGEDVNLIQAILRQLPDLEAKARKDNAPTLCDRPGLGRPEPDPVIPKHQDFSNLAVPTP